MKRHGERWKQSPELSRRDYALRAEIKAAARRAEVNNQIAATRGEIEALDKVIADEAATDKPLIMSACTLDDCHLRDLETAVEGEEYIESFVQELRAKALTRPRPLNDDLKSRYNVAGAVAEDGSDMPGWAAEVVDSRAHFNNVVFRIDVGGGEFQFWKFLYAVQAPRYLAHARLHEVPYYHEPVQVTRENWASLSLSIIRFKFKVNYACHSSIDDVPSVSPSMVHVIRDIEHVGGTFLIGRVRELPLLEYFQLLPATRHENASQERKPRSKAEQLLQKLPWLHEYNRKLDFYGNNKAFANDASDDDDGSDGSELDEEAMDEAMDELHEARSELLRTSADLDCFDFRPRILGCKWLMEAHGRPFDAVQGVSCGEETEDFAKRHTDAKTMRFTIGFGIRESSILARAWCYRMQFFSNLSVRLA
eukprot:TRINITY_DN71844_c0_g1_i1.p1 TRINITY_DN71844_c0_g1~~TRINITY_DN71844_c0_g1_i1.p1  ORF type:complete len:422 (+),score=66.68 TRINITY_DN71844_c0_g1_i1:788-2053(+)